MIEPDRDLFLPPFKMDGRGELVTVLPVVEMPDVLSAAFALPFALRGPSGSIVLDIWCREPVS